MKKLIFTLLIIQFSFLIANAQNGWIRVSDSIPNLVIMSIQFTSANTGYAVGSYNTTYPGAFLRTTNGGSNWQFYNFPNYSADDICFLNDNTGFISAWSPPPYGSYTLKTTNGGTNWICIDTLHTSFFKMKFYDLNTGIVAAKYSAVFKTTDGGYNWLLKNGVSWMEPSCIWCFDVNNWLITDNSFYINKTTNGGENWDIMDFGSINFQSQSLFFINSTTGFGSTRNGKIFKTTNKGSNWHRIDSIDLFYIYGNIFFINENTGYLCGYGSQRNIYKTINGGYNWTPQSTNTSKLMNYIFFTNPNTGYVGGEDGIIYKTTNGGVSIREISCEVPSTLRLKQSYPNPFNPVTKIKFDIAQHTPYPLSRGEMVTLKVFDITGREIQTLVNEKLNPGTYEVTFDGSNFASGVYFYQIRSGDYLETKKMLMIK